MEGISLKKCITPIITIIFLFSLSISNISIGESSIKTIYVDDDNIWGPWYGSIEHPYRYIQDAIDNARNGDTVFVYEGNYYEHIKISKKILLIGQDKNNTIIDGGNIGDVIRISTNSLKLSGFTIQNSADCGIEIEDCSDIEITGNIFRNNGVGLQIYLSSNVLISGNIVKDSSNAGIEVRLSSKILIYSNEIKDNSRGCLLLGGNRNKFMQNNFINNKWQAYFQSDLLDLNRWSGNYWDNWIPLFPKPILGGINYGMIIWFKFDWHPAKEPYDIDLDKNPIPKCNTKWFFFCNINTSGFVKTAYDFLQGKMVRVMYYDSSQGDFGNAVVNKVIKRFDSNHVYSVFIYGFKGNASWNRIINEDNIQMDGFAFAVCIKY
jgi:parallel beta-helix repeat protein